MYLFDWDEINFAECAREMIASRDYLSVTIDYVPFQEKPPLFIWMQVLSMHIFGINEFAARFPNAVCGVITLVVLFHIGKKIKNIQLGIAWALAYAGSFLPHFYFKSGLIDPWFNLFIFLSIYFYILYTRIRNPGSGIWNPAVVIFLASLFLGLGVITKGPIAFLIIILCVIAYQVIKRLRLLPPDDSPAARIISPAFWRDGAIFAFTFFIISGSWYIFQFVTNREIITGFIQYHIRLFITEDAGHGGPVYYHVLVLLLGCFPASVIAISGFSKSIYDTSAQSYFKKWMIILFFVVLILFSIVKTKIVHYSSLCYFPLSFLAACSIENEIQNSAFRAQLLLLKIRNWLIGIIGIFMGLVFTLLPFVDKYKEKIISSGIIKDEFAVENLKADVHWSGYEALPGIIFIIGIIIVLLLLKRKNRSALPVLFVLSLTTVNSAAIFIVPKIEQYTQGAAIEFYKNMKGKNCYVETLGFKSYAHLFYFSKPPQPHKDDYDLLNKKVDKPVYFVTKSTHAKEHLENHPNLKELYRKNGFVFYVKNQK